MSDPLHKEAANQAGPAQPARGTIGLPARPKRARRHAAPGGGSRRAEPTDVELGQRLWQLRLYRGITRREAAESLGVTAQQVQKYELGQDRLSIGRLVRLAQLLRTPLPVLIEGLGEERPARAAESLERRAHRHSENCALMESFERIEDPEMRDMVLSLASRLARLPPAPGG